MLALVGELKDLWTVGRDWCGKILVRGVCVGGRGREVQPEQTLFVLRGGGACSDMCCIYWSFKIITNECNKTKKINKIKISPGAVSTWNHSSIHLLNVIWPQQQHQTFLKQGRRPPFQLLCNKVNDVNSAQSSQTDRQNNCHSGTQRGASSPITAVHLYL